MIEILSRGSTSANPQVIDYWKQEGLILQVPYGRGDGTLPVHLLASLDGGSFVQIAQYYKIQDETTGDWVLNIDVTDFVRANLSLGVVFNVNDYDEQKTYYAGISLKGLINPDSVLKPDSNVFHFPIVAPTRYIGGEDTICEVYTDYSSTNPLRSSAWGWYEDGVWSNEALSKGVHSLQVDSAYTMIAFGSKSGIFPDSYTIIPIQEQECEVTYALVRWVSFTGHTRQHVFELVKPKTSVADAYSLEAIDNEYVEIKGRMDGFTLKLDNLSPYDMWYYSDVLTSSKVEVSVDRGATFNRVQVTNKDITLLTDGNMSNGAIEFNVNWRRYDAVSM